MKKIIFLVSSLFFQVSHLYCHWDIDCPMYSNKSGINDNAINISKNDIQFVKCYFSDDKSKKILYRIMEFDRYGRLIKLCSFINGVQYDYDFNKIIPSKETTYLHTCEFENQKAHSEIFYNENGDEIKYIDYMEKKSYIYNYELINGTINDTLIKIVFDDSVKGLRYEANEKRLYDGKNNIQCRQLFNDSNKIGLEDKFFYDNNLRNTKIIELNHSNPENNLEWQIEYWNNGKQKKRIELKKGKITSEYNYNDNGDIVSSKSVNEVTKFFYDKNGIEIRRDEKRNDDKTIYTFEFEKFISQNELEFDKILKEADEFYNNSSFTEAIQSYTKALKYKPNSIYSLFFRAISKQNLNDFYGASEDFEEIFKIPKYKNDKYYTNIMSSYAGNLIDLGNNSKAINILNPLINLGNKIPDTEQSINYYNRGLAKYNLKDKAGACKDLSKAGQMGYNKAYEVMQDICN